jgi:hypothetical protein
LSWTERPHCGQRERLVASFRFPTADGANPIDPRDPASAVSISDGIFLHQFLFLGGDEPPCLEAADVNADGRLTLGTPSPSQSMLVPRARSSRSVTPFRLQSSPRRARGASRPGIVPTIDARRRAIRPLQTEQEEVMQLLLLYCK